MLGANAPFFTERGFGIWHLNRPKSLGFRFLELCLSYGLVGCIGFMLEARAGYAEEPETTFRLSPVLSPTLAGVVGELRF